MKFAAVLGLSGLASANAADISTASCWDEVNNVAGYSQIECQDNSLTGWVPANDLYSPSVKSDLTSIKVYKNKLSGWIPSELGVLTRLKVYTDYRNEISGYLPSEIGSLTAMTELNIYKNKVSGTIPEESGGDPDNWPAAKINWNNFVIMNNKFSGCIPMELTVCSDDLPNNSVNGYCSMSTQGAPGIDGNCGTLAPTSAAPTTSAPTSIPMCNWNKAQKRCDTSSINLDTDVCTSAKDQRTCKHLSEFSSDAPCAWTQGAIKKGRRVVKKMFCVKEPQTACDLQNDYKSCMAHPTGCAWSGARFAGSCGDVSATCDGAADKTECYKVDAGCYWKARGLTRAQKKAGKSRCVDLPVTCRTMKSVHVSQRQSVCESIGVRNKP
jgi:hypothetical protein